LIYGTENDPRLQSNVVAFREGLATFGWAEGRNLRIDYRFVGDPSRLAADAEELVNLRPDVIFALSGPVAAAVQQRTSVIPIVFVGGLDPAALGLVGNNIARPEGNMTGFANGFGSLGGRWLELFKDAVPRLSRVADNFFVGGFPGRNELRATIAAAAAQLGATIVRIPVRNAVEIEPAISAFAAEPDGGLLLTRAAVSVSFAAFAAIGRRALYYHLPLMYGATPGAARTEGFHDGSWRGPTRPGSACFILC
jgi:putative ABC transport system substrate-binding protein